MKKKLATFVCTSALMVAMAVPACAGQWQSNTTGWWWQEDNGSYPVNQWEWLDGNKDGVYECYYFNGNGYMLANTTTPDGYTVNADGAWVENGVVQTQVKTQAENDIPNVEGTYVGTYKGHQIKCVIENDAGGAWVEVDEFMKDYMPDYTGNGVFEDAWNRFSFTDSTLIFEDFYSGEKVSFVKQ